MRDDRKSHGGCGRSGTGNSSLQRPMERELMAREPELTAEHGNDGGHHYAEIVRPEMLGQWAIEKNPTLRYLHEAMQDCGNPSRRPVLPEMSA
jgi:hypothetical protein